MPNPHRAIPLEERFAQEHLGSIFYKLCDPNQQFRPLPQTSKCLNESCIPGLMAQTNAWQWTWTDRLVAWKATPCLFSGNKSRRGEIVLVRFVFDALYNHLCSLQFEHWATKVVFCVIIQTGETWPCRYSSWDVYKTWSTSFSLTTGGYVEVQQKKI